MPALDRKQSKKASDASELIDYYRQISKTSLLTAEQEIELAERIKRGDAQAKAQLAEANLRLVVKLARKFRHPEFSLSDMVQEGNLGLLEAVEKFDPKKGCRFSTYACWWIRQAISRAIANKGRSIRLPVHINELLSKYRRLNSKVLASTGCNASLREAAATILPVDPETAQRKVARRCKSEQIGPKDARVSEMIENMEQKAESKLQSILSMAVPPVSLESPLSDDSDGTLKDLIPGEEDLSTPNLDRASLAWLLSHLSDPERQLLALRYGFDGGSSRTFSELAKMLGVSRESVRQQELKALRKLRDLATQAKWN